MDVVASNFKSVLGGLEEAINKCTFISIDCEFTGLDLERNINAFDTPQQYYEKLRANSKDFLVIQYGLSIFRYDKEENLFKNQTYNFYIFRRPINRNIPDQRFLCQTSSIHFLVREGFDFNKLFKEGISYLNLEEEEKYRNSLEEASKKRMDNIKSERNETNDVIPVPADAQQFIDGVVEQIEEFLASDKTELQLPKCNSFYRRLIYQTRSGRFAGKINLETRQLENRERALFVSRMRTREEEIEVEKQKLEEQLREVGDFLGFTTVLRLIINAGKLLIGHNVCLDLMHTHDKFLNPLPEGYQEFKRFAHALFPNVVDTKYMSSLEPFKEHISSTVLKQLFDTVSGKPFEVPTVVFEQEGAESKLASGKEHEAGYDAYITGLSFLSMWKFLGTTSGVEDEKIFTDFNLLGRYMNKIYLMFLADNQYIHLGGNDMRVTRDHVFYLTFPKQWKMDNIVQLFSPFGNVYVSWLSETSAYVSLYNRDQAAVALSALSQSDAYTITTFAMRQLALSRIATPLASPVPKKRGSAEGLVLPTTSKRQKTDSFNSSGTSSRSKRSIDPIAEEDQAETDEGSPANKVFTENDVWE